VIPDGDAIKAAFERETTKALAQATLTPPDGPRRTGGRTGNHSEHMGYLLAVMQSVPRAHPGARW
jgi:ring-1,2-phenylacetyl-CoA epoxidase subunit PaaC